jgi:hypothetical protein
VFIRGFGAEPTRNLLWLSDDHRYSLPITIGPHWWLFVAVAAAAVWRRSDRRAGEIKGFLLGYREEPLKGWHGNLLSVRLNAEMEGDYSEPGLMASRHLQQIDLPSSYLVCALWKSSPAEATTFADRCIVSHRLSESDAAQQDWAEITVIIGKLMISDNRIALRKEMPVTFDG